MMAGMRPVESGGVRLPKWVVLSDETSVGHETPGTGSNRGSNEAGEVSMRKGVDNHFMNFVT
jgi:hypothetical protein